MEIKLKIDGMSCHHCSARVQSFLESQEGLSDVLVDLDRKKAGFSCNEDQDVEVIVQGINALGYKAVQD